LIFQQLAYKFENETCKKFARNLQETCKKLARN
jgi:hypothetical protein